jgi:ketosteroid isomerase-like protein
MNSNPEEMSIREIVEARIRAVQAGDPDAMVEFVADDVVIFDVVPPLVSHGKQTAYQRGVEWLGSYEGTVSWDTGGIVVTASADVAFCHFVSRVQGTLKSGQRIDMRFRTTLGFQKIVEGWRITHEHSSDPFDPETGKALTHLQP